MPRIFWDFLNASNKLGNPNDPRNPSDRSNPNNSNAPDPPQVTGLPWYFSSGLPISEPYWARAAISGQEKEVMVQLFERRALTYVPQNRPEWRVEMANIGQHYFDWRYRNLGVCSGQEALVGTPAPPRLAPTPPPPLTRPPTTPAPPTPTPAPTEEEGDGPHATVYIVAYVDTNGNDGPDPGEGLTGLRVVLIHRRPTLRVSALRPMRTDTLIWSGDGKGRCRDGLSPENNRAELDADERPRHKGPEVLTPITQHLG